MLTKSELARWTTALRSGEYIQGRSYLKHHDGITYKHCCLGVLCEVEGLSQKTHFGKFVEFDNRMVGHLSGSMSDKLGCQYGRFKLLEMPDLCGYSSLWAANDCGVPFSEIADHLDKYYPATE